MDWVNRLPVELLLIIGEILRDSNDIDALASLAAATRRANAIFEPVVYDIDIQNHANSGVIPRLLFFGAWNDLSAVIEKSEAAMTRFSRRRRLAHSLDVNFIGYRDSTRRNATRTPPYSENNPMDGEGSALHVACYRGNDNAVWTLLELGADVNLPSHRMCDHGGLDGWRPLHFALCRGHSTTAKILIEKGASYLTREASSQERRTPRGVPIQAIHDASSSTHPKWLFDLIQDKIRQGHGDWGDYGAPVENVINSMTERGAPIHFAVEASKQHGTKQLANLIDLGADINAEAKVRASPLSLAVRRGNWPAAILLLDKGAILPQTKGNRDRILRDAIWTIHHHLFFPIAFSSAYYLHPVDGRGYAEAADSTGAIWYEQQRQVIQKAGRG